MKAFKFTQYLVYWLYDHRQIAIPGIGIFTLERTPAKQTAGENTIEPPSYQITFQEDRGWITDDSFFRKLKMYYPSLTKQLYTEFGKNIIEKMNDGQSVNIQGIGVLSIDQGRMVFEQDRAATTLLTRHYTKLKMRLFAKPMQVVSWLDIKLSKIPHKIWILLLPVLGALVLLSSTYILYHNKVPTSTYENQNSQDQYPKPVEDSITSFDTLNTSDSILDQGNIAIDSVGISPEGETIKKCIIITGAYRSDRYKNIMIARIQDEGYEVYTEELDGLVRVGIQFECTASTLPEMLEKVRNSIDKNAWHLEEEE